MAGIDKIYSLIKENASRSPTGKIHIDDLTALAIVNKCFTSKYYFKDNVKTLSRSGLIKYNAPYVELVGRGEQA